MSPSKLRASSKSKAMTLLRPTFSRKYRRAPMAMARASVSAAAASASPLRRARDLGPGPLEEELDEVVGLDAQALPAGHLDERLLLVLGERRYSSPKRSASSRAAAGESATIS